MLCPEVWNFSTHQQSIFIAEKSDLRENNCLENIKKFTYTHLVSIVLPDTLRTPERLSEILTTDSEYYKITNLPIKELIEENFINSFIKKGYFVGLSINRRIDCDDCLCVTPNGSIILSLTKDSYQSLGLDGKLSHFCKNTKNRYIVYVDLLKECFKPNKKNYERTKECLSRLGNITFIVNWQPYQEDICPSSIAKYFHDLHYDVKTCVPNVKVFTDYKVKVPRLDVENVHELVEWLGAFSTQSDLKNGGPDNYLHNYETPEPWIQYGQVKHLQWRGLFSPKQIENIFQELRKYVKPEEEHWVSMYIQGFSDSPINWNFQENHYFTNGDNSFTIILNPKNCLLFKQMCSRKYYK